jgi:hypothetical protein
MSELYRSVGIVRSRTKGHGVCFFDDIAKVPIKWTNELGILDTDWSLFVFLMTLPRFPSNEQKSLVY